MTLTEAYNLLELDHAASLADVKEQYWWFVKFYHPDNQETHDVVEFTKIIKAYQIIQEHT